VKTTFLSKQRTSSQFARTLAVMLGLLALAWPVFSQQPVASVKSGADATKIYLQGERSFSVSYSGKATTVQALSSGQLRPLALAAGDLDADGIEDLVVGYASGNGGVLAIYRGSLDAFAPQSQASWQAIGEGRFPSPFLSQVKAVELPEAPDFVATGNFTGDGHLDVLVGARGSNTLYVLSGDGKGGLLAPKPISLPGALTALATARLDSSTTYSHIAAATSAQTGAEFTIFEGSASGVSAIASAALRAPATSIAFGSLSGDNLTDVAVVAGGELAIVHGRDIRAARAGVASANLPAEAVSLPFMAAAVTVGSFIQDRASRLQMAVLGTDGSVHIVTRAGLDTRPWTFAEMQTRRRARLNRQPDPLAVAVDSAEGWKVAESFPGVVSTANPNQPPVFFRTRISSRGSDDVMILDSTSAQIHVLGHESLPVSGATAESLPPSFHSTLPMSAAQATVAGIPMRVNIDGRPGVVVLKQGQMLPQVMMPLPDPTFFVNKFTDPTPTSPIANACNNTSFTDLTSSCSLREAIIKANTTAGTDTVMLTTGTYTLTIPRNPADHSSSQTGTLEVQDSLNIVGATDGSGNPASVVQGGTSLATSVDKVFSFNQDIDSFTDATVSISNLVIQNGFNRGNTTILDGWGGAFDFDTGNSGNNTLTVTNCNITTNTLTEGEGGGFAIFNTNDGTGFADIVTSTIQSNTTAPSSPSGVAGNGGGIFVGTPAGIVISNSKVLNNSANANAGVNPVGGGLELIGPSGGAGQSAIHGATISGNHAAGDGGGIWNTTNLLIDTTSVINSNSASGNGGGIWHNALDSTPADTLALTKVTITGNTATGSGGGIYSGNLSGGVTLSIQFSRLAGNTAPGGSANLENIASVVTAINNWWGTNTPATTINTTGGGTTGFTPFIVLTNTASPSVIRINQSAALTGNMSQDNLGNTGALAGNLAVFNALPITFNNPVLGTIPEAQPEALAASAQATATFTAGGVGGTGSANAVVDQQTATATIIVLQPPAITKSFNPTSAAVNAASTITFSVTNGNTTTINASFVDSMPANLVVATTPSVVNNCNLGGGTVTATSGSGTISFSNPALPVGTCTITVNVQATTDGVFNNSVTIDSTDAGNGNTASATLTVSTPPAITKAFGLPSMPVNDTTSLTFTIQNPNSTLALTGVAFTDNLPVSMVVGNPNNLFSSCGGPVTAVPGSTQVSLSGGNVAVSTSCAVSISVQGTTPAVLNNAVQVSSTNGGTGNTSLASITIVKADTTTTVVSSANPSVLGQSVTFTATVSAVAPGAGTASGTVTFLDGGSPVGTGTLSAGVATFTTSALAVGSHTITTSYGGDGNFNGNTGSLTGNPQVVNKANSSTTVTSSVNPSVFGQSLTFTATVAPVAPGAGTVTGTVTFLDGGTSIGTGTLSGGVAMLTTSALAVGSHTITTSYGGDGDFNGSAGALTGNPQVVNKANSSVAVTSSLNPSSVGQSVTFTATVSAAAPGAGTPSGTVTFLDGGTSIGTGTLVGGVASLVTSTLAAGNHTITVSYGGDGDFNGSIGSLTGNPQVVNKANSATAVTSSLNPSVFGQSLTFTATVSAVAPATGTPTGTVTFLDGGSSIGTGTVSAGVATFTTSALAAGNHTITASYGGDGSFNGSTGSLTGNPQVVNKANSTSTVTSLVNPSVFGQSTTFTATVSAVAPGAGTPTGTVTFLDGGSSIGTGTLSGGVATFTTSALAVGNHTITTSYGGDGNFNGSTGSLTGNPQVVNQANSAQTLTSSANPSALGQSVTFTATVSAVAPGAGTPTGILNFLDGGTLLGTGPLSGGVATFSTSALALGNHTIHTSYAGDANFTGSFVGLTGNPQVVNKVSSATAVTSSLNPAAVGQSITFTATVSAVAPGTGTPTGTVTFLNGGTSIGTGTLSGGVATFSTSALTAGNHTITANYGGDGNFGTSTGSLTGNPQVVIGPPSIAKAFGAAAVPLNGTTTLTLTVTNPAANTVAEAGVAFADSFPAGIAVATPNGLTNTCGGTATATAGSGSVSLTGGTVATNSNCTVTVNVTATNSGSVTNTTGPVSSTNGGTGGTASANLTVGSPPVIAKSFGAAKIAMNGSTTLTFAVNNPAANTVPLTGVAFTDTLPAGLQVSTPNGLSGSCGGGTITAGVGSAAVSLAGATLPVGGSCTFAVNVTGITAGVQNNTVVVTSANAGTGNTSNATVTVAGPPTIQKAFGAASIALSGSTSLTFTLNNPNTATSLTGVGFSDALPAGLAVSTPNGLTGTCGGGTITAVAGSNVATLTGATLAASAPCSFSVNVTGIAGGVQNNVTGAVNSVEGGAGTTAAASITVLAPDLTIAKSHVGDFKQGQQGATYTIIASNQGAAPTAGTVTVVDTLPSALTPSAFAGTGWTCTVASLTCTRSDVLAIGASYPALTLTVNASGTAPTSVTNVATVSGGGETNTTNDTTMDVTTIDVVPPDFSISIAPPADTVKAGQPADFAITLTPLNNVPVSAPIALSVTGLPPRTSFTLQASVTPGSSPATNAFVILTTEADPFLAKNAGASRLPVYATLLPFVGLLLSGVGFRKRIRTKGQAVWLCLLLTLGICGAGLSGCASAGNLKKLGTPPGTYTVTVTGTLGNVQHAATVTLTVQP